MSLPYDNRLNTRAREMRKKMNPHESKLWYMFLRGYPFKFYRQRVIECFIVDFYCPAAKLVVELDGSQHYSEQGMSYDAERTAKLAELGLRVLRFSNDDVDKHFDAVCEQIDLVVRERSEGVPRRYRQENPSVALRQLP